MPTALNKSHDLSRAHVDDTPKEQRKQLGQYFTPIEVAEFMASLIPRTMTGNLRILDPGAGTGILGIAAAQSLLAGATSSISLTSFEVDKSVIERLDAALTSATRNASGRLAVDLRESDFLEATEGSLFSATADRFDIAIANPPYFKTSPSTTLGGTDPNAYARFMRRSAELLVEGGYLVFIVPRSFASGFYFRRFRSFLREHLSLERIHVFESRRDAFKDQSVLQENIIVVYRKGEDETPTVEVSTSVGVEEMKGARLLKVPRDLIYATERDDASIRIPTTAQDVALLKRFDKLPTRLRELSLEISTGPVVPFRAIEHLVADDQAERGSTVPLLWLQHVTAEGVAWPISGFKKPQRLAASAPSKLRVPNQTCVLLRRFSAKEDQRRLVAGVLRGGQLAGPWIGLENHLNFVYRPGGSMQVEEAIGLSRLLNSRTYDDYFRICNGNTQVGATEMRELPLPASQELFQLGRLDSSTSRIDTNACDFIGI